MMTCYKSENEHYEVFVETDVFIKDKAQQRYFVTGRDKLSKDLLARLISCPEKISLPLFVCVLAVFGFLLVMNILLVTVDRQVVDCRLNEQLIWYALPYLFLNVFCHELAHIKALNIMGKQIDRVGFKLNYWVMTAVYVAMNDVHLISRRSQVVVHGAGVFVNYLMINIVEGLNQVFWHQSSLSACFVMFSYALLWNVVPVLNSDGYKLLLVAFNLNELTSKRENHWLIWLVQVISVLLALSFLLSYIDGLKEWLWN